MQPANETIVIVGLGLLGSSLAKSIKTKLPSTKVIGVSSDRSIQAALTGGMIDAGYHYQEIDQWKGEASIVFLCTPISHILDFFGDLQKSAIPFRSDCIISDVGSTKEEVCQAAKILQGVQFIGGHPMAGSEKSGIDAGDPLLYESAFWVLCPEPTTPKADIQRLERVIRCTGARIVLRSPQEHDAQVARVSHLPQILSSVLAHTIADGSPESIYLAGQGFRDMTRLSESSFSMWSGIFETNSTEILSAIDEFSEKLSDFRQTMVEKNTSAQEQVFATGASMRQQLPEAGNAFAQGLVDLIVQVPDTKGILLSIIQPLANEGLDIRDMELIKVREGNRGSFRLAFRSYREAEEAAKMLREQNLECEVRN